MKNRNQGVDPVMAQGRPLSKPVDVFIVDSDPSQRRVLAGVIADRAVGRFSPRVCASPEEAFNVARDGSSAIVIADLDTIGGTDRLGEIARPMLSLIATSARGSVNTAVAAVKAGAVDFLPKPIGAAALLERLEAAVATWAAPEEQTTGGSKPVNTPSSPAGAHDFGGFIGRSPAMHAIYDQIRRMAPSRAPVFITGESGTGKEVAAETIHAHSGPDDRPFVAINCSAIPRDLMESEIFGHVRGAFTGAADNRVGAAELADGGTLFLDEIAEMDLSLQAKLLRFIQSGTLTRVGGSELKRVDVRFVCATNRDAFAEVECGRFRSDLFYRLHVLPIHLPPLRERREDILPLAHAFLARFAAEENRGFTGFEPAAEERLLNYPWPGNIRQLQNVIRRTVVLHDGVRVAAAMLPLTVAGNATVTAAAEAGISLAPPGILSFRDQERRIIEDALAAFGGNVPRAAAALEISPATIYRKVKAWTIPARV
jgi:two-component system, repressor protein LuxO